MDWLFWGIGMMLLVAIGCCPMIDRRESTVKPTSTFYQGYKHE